MYVYIYYVLYVSGSVFTYPQKKNIIPQTSIDPENRSSQDFKRNVI